MEFVNQSLQFSDGYPSQYDEHGDILERVVEGCESEISDSQPDSRYFREPIASSTAIHGSLQSRSRSVDPLASSTMIEVSDDSSDDEDSGCGSSVCTFSISSDLEDSLVDEDYLRSLQMMSGRGILDRQPHRLTSTRTDLLRASRTTASDNTTQTPCCTKIGFKNPVKAIRKIFRTKKSKEIKLWTLTLVLSNQVLYDISAAPAWTSACTCIYTLLIWYNKCIEYLKSTFILIQTRRENDVVKKIENIAI